MRGISVKEHVAVQKKYASIATTMIPTRVRCERTAGAVARKDVGEAVTMSPAYADFMQSSGDGPPEAGVAGVPVDGLEIILSFAVETGANAAHFVRARGVNGVRCFLLGVHPKGAEEIRHADDPAAGLLETREQVPIEGEVKARVDAAGEIPGAFAPEQRFLGHVVDPLQRFRIVSWHDPPADIAILVV